MASAAQRKSTKSEGQTGGARPKPGPAGFGPQSEHIARRRIELRWPTHAAISEQYAGYKDLVDRAIEVFGDDLTASRWLSTPSHDLEGKVPLQVAQSVDYDPERMTQLFEPIFIRIEHGIDR